MKIDIPSLLCALGSPFKVALAITAYILQSPPTTIRFGLHNTRCRHVGCLIEARVVGSGSRIRLKLITLVVVVSRRISGVLLLVTTSPGRTIILLNRFWGTATTSGSTNSRKLINMFPMHSKEVFFHMVRSIEGLVTHITMEWFLLSMDVLVSSVKVASVGSIRAERTCVSFSTRRCWTGGGHTG